LRLVVEILKVEDAFLCKLVRVPRPDDHIAASSLTIAVATVVEVLKKHVLGKQLLDHCLLAHMVNDSFDAQVNLEG
jgi:hypothetical protein